MKTIASWIFVVTVAIAAGCLSSGKKGPRGTNVGVGSDGYDGPWSQGGTAARVDPGVRGESGPLQLAP